MLTSKEIEELEGCIGDSSSIDICPVLVSPFPKEGTEVGIEINTVAPSTLEKSREHIDQKKEHCLIIVDSFDPRAWYQIKSIKTENSIESFIIKLKDNHSLWNLKCSFRECIVTATLCNDILIVALSDNTIQFIDSETGVICLPSFYVEGGVRYLKSFADRVFICISNLQRVQLYNYSGGNNLSLILDELYYGDMPEIQDVMITNELPGGAISPIICFKDYSVRWSDSTNFWVFHDEEIPKGFVKSSEFFTVADMEQEFTDALLFSESEKFFALFKELLKFYLNDDGSKAVVLIKQLIKRKMENIDEYCGINMQVLYDTAFDIVTSVRPEIMEKIKELPEYQKYEKQQEEIKKQQEIKEQTEKMLLESKQRAQLQQSLQLKLAEQARMAKEVQEQTQTLPPLPQSPQTPQQQQQYLMQYQEALVKMMGLPLEQNQQQPTLSPAVLQAISSHKQVVINPAALPGIKYILGCSLEEYKTYPLEKAMSLLTRCNNVFIANVLLQYNAALNTAIYQWAAKVTNQVSPKPKKTTERRRRKKEDDIIDDTEIIFSSEDDNEEVLDNVFPEEEEGDDNLDFKDFGDDDDDDSDGEYGKSFKNIPKKPIKPRIRRPRPPPEPKSEEENPEEEKANEEEDDHEEEEKPKTMDEVLMEEIKKEESVAPQVTLPNGMRLRRTTQIAIISAKAAPKRKRRTKKEIEEEKKKALLEKQQQEQAQREAEEANRTEEQGFLPQPNEEQREEAEVPKSDVFEQHQEEPQQQPEDDLLPLQQEELQQPEEEAPPQEQEEAPPIQEQEQEVPQQQEEQQQETQPIQQQEQEVPEQHEEIDNEQMQTESTTLSNESMIAETKVTKSRAKKAQKPKKGKQNSVQHTLDFFMSCKK